MTDEQRELVLKAQQSSEAAKLLLIIGALDEDLWLHLSLSAIDQLGR